MSDAEALLKIIEHLVNGITTEAQRTEVNECLALLRAAVEPAPAPTEPAPY